jgi:osmotically-inducible protein OsmY
MYITMKTVAIAGFSVVASLTAVVAQVPPVDHIGRKVPDHQYHTDPGDVDMATADALISKDLRQALTNDESLSASAKNVGIVVADGIVQLQGTVPSDHEKARIVDLAIRIAGADRVNDQLDVVP